MPQRFDLTTAENQLKLHRADALAVLADKHQLSLVEMAVAFVLVHPAISSAIIGPRTMEQLESQLGAAELALPAEVLDAIDEIVPPGTNSSPNDGGYEPPALTDARLRRRPG
jgi:aryl-alcohol dehydrogenase-like predicted oxidoreductase